MMTRRSAITLFISFFLGHIGGGSAEHTSPTALTHGKKHSTGALRRGSGASMGQLQKDMKEAVDEALGIGHGIQAQGLEEIRQGIQPMWRALHKNQQGRVDRPAFRYLVQRFFRQRYHLSIVGLEPNLATDTQSEAVLLTSFAPNYVRRVLEGDRARDGFLMEDAVAMIAAIRRLVEHSGTHMLEDVYQTMGLDITMEVDRRTLHKILEGYMLRWMMADDMESVRMLEGNESLKEAAFDDWQQISNFVLGEVTQFQYARQHTKVRSTMSGGNPLNPRFSLADAQAIVGSMALRFGHYWETECHNVRDSLVKMDYSNNGRVKMSDFHGSALNQGEWRFSESKDYLKQMGALDETSSWQGPRVIITNYLQAPSNCIIATEHYRVCCSNDCEHHFSDLEEALGGAVATPEEILPVIESMRSGLDEDEARLTSSLRQQLQEIAATHAGKVPIHGRLFAQWMHYVFPLDCAFPHKSGTTITSAPLAFGDDYMASEEEMVDHSILDSNAASIPEASSSLQKEEWMSQWSHEEELLTDPRRGVSPDLDFSTCALALMFLGLIVSLLAKSGIISSRGAEDQLPTARNLKSHYI